MAKKIIIELTQKEAMQLLMVAGNGYGDGDFYGVNDRTGKGNGYGDRREENAFIRAYEKVAVKLNLERTTP